MTEQHATVTINAPEHQVYRLFTHFNDFPKFMSFVKEVTYYDDQRSHWVAQVAGEHQWDAVNEDWILDQQIGWRSTSGLKNTGRIKFQALDANRTMVDVYISYDPPAGVLGKAADMMGVEDRFAEILQRDLNNFAQMVEQAPPGALDPMQSHYLFQSGSVVARGEATKRQQEAMSNDPMMSKESLHKRQATIEQEIAHEREARLNQAVEQEQRARAARQATQEQQQVLQKQATLDQQQARQRQEQEAAAKTEQTTEHHTFDPVKGTLGGRNASMERTSLGERDARRQRFPNEQEDPMLSRAPASERVEQLAEESPWYRTIRGSSLEEGQITANEEEKDTTQEQADDQRGR